MDPCDPDLCYLEPLRTALAQTKGSVATGGEHTSETNKRSMQAEPDEASEGDAAYDPEHSHLEPPPWESSEVNGSANEGMQQPNFSYVALLKGYIDLNGAYQTTNTQRRESCLYDTHNDQTNDGGEPLLHLQQTKARDCDTDNTPSHEDSHVLGDFVDDQDNSPMQLEDVDAQTTTFDDILLDPWRPTLFDDILLDEVDTNNEGTRE
ncbi:hypothetical protein ZWY2020_011995 [Hordeum vulgare]|nr:hypothetical protein ZWY2020_011995 [Hordeum vulgare]